MTGLRSVEKEQSTILQSKPTIASTTTICHNMNFLKPIYIDF
jgi:hypothetical protein